ncbi:uncharacterized protein RCC_12263 [Ramularia collo-cygni]|uniref:Velvet domain-containing protein n=1 Tax=Ramularia collo-cygni TaxID=112498 RepID=A0A2D3UT17_9PEZI|nr:uncharacterized protein RCC_12263 [Ramularia collo-cygni]CZT14907.1 uncharacterized protein RCC_12263 [Ramularia collo-cygni]
MSDSTQKTYLRDSHGPRVVDAGKGRSSSRRQTEDSDKQRSKHSSSRKSSKQESSHSRKSSSTPSSSSNNNQERPSFELDIIGQPQRAIIFGTAVEASVMVSLKLPTADMAASYRNLDTSRLLAVVSLVADSRSGERTVAECGTLTGQKMFDSVHPIPEECVPSLARSQPCRLAVGYFSFPGLLIRQPGSYRLRIALIKMGSSESSSSGGSTISTIDSESIRVERRPTGASSHRKHQRTAS